MPRVTSAMTLCLNLEIDAGSATMPLFQWLLRGDGTWLMRGPRRVNAHVLDALLFRRALRRLNELVHRANHALEVAHKRLEKFGLLRRVALQFEFGLMGFKIARI